MIYRMHIYIYREREREKSEVYPNFVQSHWASLGAKGRWKRMTALKSSYPLFHTPFPRGTAKMYWKLSHGPSWHSTTGSASCQMLALTTYLAYVAMTKWVAFSGKAENRRHFLNDRHKINDNQGIPRITLHKSRISTRIPKDAQGNGMFMLTGALVTVSNLVV